MASALPIRVLQQDADIRGEVAMPSAALRAAHCPSTGHHAGHRPAAARGIAYCLLAVALLAPGGAVAADDCLQQIAVQPGRSVDVAVSASRLLIEEVGTDIEYRWNASEDFTAVATPPDRLGFDVLAARSRTLTLRIREGQGGGQIRIGSCLDDADATFFSGLAALQTRSLEAGRDAARAALPALTYLRRWPLAARHAGWVSSAHANVLASAGENNAAETAFLDSSRDWQQAGRPDRAAIALMAAGDNASRANRFDVAREWLTQARDELERLGVTYYALRSEGALCTVLAREGRYREAIACEEQVIARWNVQQEKRETAVREISVANLYLRFKENGEAQQHFLRAEAVEIVLPPPLRARLQTGLGNLALSRGDLPDAAKRYALAIQLRGNNGLPAEQANLDLKLANLARFAGAVPERQRLLQAASTSLSGTENPLPSAELDLLLGEALLQRGDAAGGLAAARRAASVCLNRAAADCINDSALLEIEALLDLGEIDAAESKLTTLERNALSTLPRRTVLTARLDLINGNAKRALQRLTASAPSDDAPSFRVERTLLLAQALAHTGQRNSALKELQTTLLDQAARIVRWPSIALRISARERVARLQAAMFDQILSDADDTIPDDDFIYLRTAIDTVSALRLFAGANNAPLSTNLREALSAAVSDGSFARQRELFSALTATDAGAGIISPPISTAAGVPNLPDTLVILPLGGEREFHLLAVQSGKAKRCLRWPIAQYRDLVARFTSALDGDTTEFVALQTVAESIHSAIRHCHADARSPRHWQVVRVAGTPALSWAWIAAATAQTEDEPTVTHTLDVAEQPPPPSKPRKLLLLDLDMPGVSPLPQASRELTELGAELRRRSIEIRQIHASDLPAEALLEELASSSAVHVVGHANPAAFGQLYQGLWYEAGGKPSLLTYPEIASSHLRAELVVLSACGTRADEQQAFGATAWLAEAFLAAGASHVIAAANPLSDAAAPLWTTRFHSALWSGADIATAARDARAALRASPHFRSPMYWAGIEHLAATSKSSRTEPSRE